ncbi:MAG: hypothetical protein CMI80_01315 [Candidatus Pelagibacter sp.]|nr:hypothetical protein [Candidatus Pelagibacter sp.]
MKKFGLVVIGAHIGVHIQQDLEKYKNQNILLIEPVPHNVGALKKNTSKFKNIIIDPISVSSKKEIKKFYFVKAESINKLGKHWASGIGSFKKQHILDHKTKRFNIGEIDIDFVEIQSLSFSDLVKKHLISSIDKLQIDVEGSEYEILKSLNYDELNINKIIFESKHFDGTFTEGDKLEEIKQKLTEKGYKINKLDKENFLAEKF